MVDHVLFNMNLLKGHTKQKSSNKNLKTRQRLDSTVKCTYANGNSYPADIAEKIKKIDYAHPKINVENLQGSKQNYKWLTPSLNNYGVISAKDLARLKAISTELTNVEYILCKTHK